MRTSEPAQVPPIVHEVLRRPGRPLDAATRAFFEPRFGHDFSHVRVHTDARAAESAAAVNALAYTVGRDVVFGAGQYDLASSSGRRLLAHELTHVVQQRNVVSTATVEFGKPGDEYERDAERTAAQVVAHIPSEAAVLSSVHSSRTAVLSGVWVDCGTDEDCPPRARGEVERSRTVPLQSGTLEAPERGFIVSHFAVNSADVSRLATDPTWHSFVATLAAGRDRWEILGFSDCQGGAAANTAIRTARANVVYAALPPGAQANIDSAAGAASSDCVAANDTEANRAYNRSVVFRRTQTFIEFPGETITGGSGASCRIDVRATHIGGILAGAPVYHLFLVYTNSAGAESYYRGGSAGDVQTWPLAIMARLLQTTGLMFPVL